MASKSGLKSCLMWEIERPCHGNDSQSPYFRFFEENWYIKISVKKNIGVYGEYIVYVTLASQNGEEETIIKKDVSVSCLLVAGKVVFYDSKGFTDLGSKNDILTFSILLEDFENSSPQGWKIYCRISCEEPASIQIDNEKILLSTGSLLSDNKSVKTVAEFPAELQRLSDDFYSLLDKGSIPDAKLTCCGRTWNVHRSILTARSVVFAAMFRSGMKDSETGEVCIEDIDAAVLDSLLKYVYSGKVLDLSGENVCGMYEAADKYALLGLKDVCCVWMANKLSLENCFQFLVVADTHSEKWLRDKAMSFITKHYKQIRMANLHNFEKEYPLLAHKVLVHQYSVHSLQRSCILL